MDIEQLKKELLEAIPFQPITVNGKPMRVQNPSADTMNSILPAAETAARMKLSSVDEFLKGESIDNEWTDYLDTLDKPDEMITTLKTYGLPTNPKNMYDFQRAKLALNISSMYMLAAYIADEDGIYICNDPEMRDWFVKNCMTSDMMNEIGEAVKKLNPTTPSDTGQELANGQDTLLEAENIEES